MSTFAGRYSEMLFKHVGNRVLPATSATVTVYESDGSTEASLYTDRTKATAAANPVSPDAAGNLEFFAAPGTYVLSVVEDGSVVATNTVAVQPDPLEPSSSGATNLTWDAASSTVESDTGTDATITTVDGTNPGLMTVTQKSKLDGIETAATADQTAAEIVATFTGTPDGTLFLRDDGTLAAAGGGAGATNLTWTASTSTVASDTGTDAVITAVDATNPGLMVVADKTKLDGIESAATADQTGAEIKTAYEAEADTNAYTDAEKSKLGGVEALADVTDATNVAAAGAVMETTFPVVLGFAISDETTAITTGTAKLTARAPFAFTLTGVSASLTTASSSGIPTFDINESGVSVLSTKLTIDATEKTSTTAAAAAVISDSAIADDAELTFDIDVAGTGATGAKIWLIGTRNVA